MEVIKLILNHPWRFPSRENVSFQKKRCPEIQKTNLGIYSCSDSAWATKLALKHLQPLKHPSNAASGASEVVSNAPSCSNNTFRVLGCLYSLCNFSNPNFCWMINLVILDFGNLNIWAYQICDRILKAWIYIYIYIILFPYFCMIL